MSDVLSTIGTRRKASTPISQSAPRTRDQVKNAAGGYAYKAGDEMRLHRFLTLGTDGSTYYTSAKELTVDNAEVLFRMVDSKGIYVVQQIVEVSEAGRAPKNKQAIFALAVAAARGDEAVKIAAYAAVPKVIRTGTHLFEFINYSMQFRGWGMGLRKAIGRWFTTKDVDRLAYQVLKYRQREGITHFDLLRQSHATAHVPTSVEHAALFNWICTRSAPGGKPAHRIGTIGRHGFPIMDSPRVGKGSLIDREGVQIDAELPKLVYAFEELQRDDVTLKRVVELIDSGVGISWEMIPDKFINEKKVWTALIGQGLPQTALMRQLPRITRVGLTTGTVASKIAAQLQDSDLLKKGRVHPINVLVALRTYKSGHSERGSSTWSPVSKYIDALDTAFYNAYGAVEPAGVRTLEALDISASMTWSNVSGLPITPREASAAMSMVSVATERDAQVVAFSSGGWQSAGVGRRSAWGAGISTLDISPRRRLDDNIRTIQALPAGGTDCALPMVWATKTGQEIDAFRIYTDNETWAGDIHVDQALENYRQKMGIDARLEIVSMTATGTSLCDPNDPRQLDVSGFDSTVPQLLADHSGGRV